MTREHRCADGLMLTEERHALGSLALLYGIPAVVMVPSAGNLPVPRPGASRRPTVSLTQLDHSRRLVQLGLAPGQSVLLAYARQRGNQLTARVIPIADSRSFPVPAWVTYVAIADPQDRELLDYVALHDGESAPELVERTRAALQRCLRDDAALAVSKWPPAVAAWVDDMTLASQERCLTHPEDPQLWRAAYEHLLIRALGLPDADDVFSALRAVRPDLPELMGRARHAGAAKDVVCYASDPLIEDALDLHQSGLSVEDALRTLRQRTEHEAQARAFRRALTDLLQAAGFAGEPSSALLRRIQQVGDGVLPAGSPQEAARVLMQLDRAMELANGEQVRKHDLTRSFLAAQPVLRHHASSWSALNDRIRALGLDRRAWFPTASLGAVARLVRTTDDALGGLGLQPEQVMQLLSNRPDPWEDCARLVEWLRASDLDPVATAASRPPSPDGPVEEEALWKALVQVHRVREQLRCQVRRAQFVLSMEAR